MESVEHLIVGGGPAGLRAAQVLAEAGREVLVLEKRAQIGTAAAERARRFGWPAVACDILRIYRDTLEQSTLGRSLALLPHAAMG